jgi:siroheme synthase-like protein
MLHGPRLRVLIAGGGSVAARRAGSLLDAGATVTAVAPHFSTDLPEGCSRVRRRFEPADVDGCNLVIAATDRPEVNSAVAEACEARGILCCRADDAAAGDLGFAAKQVAGPIVVGLSAGSPAVTRRVAGDVARVLAAHTPFATSAKRLREALVTQGEAGRSAARDLSSDAAADAFARGGASDLIAWLRVRHPGVDLEGAAG